MNVLHYVQRWLPLSEQFVAAQIRHSRHAPTVVSREAFENLAAFPQRPRSSLAARLRVVPHRFERPAITASLVVTARRRRADVVHVHFGYRAPDVLGAARRLSLPLIVSLHGNDVTAFARAWPAHYDAVFESAAALIVPSQFLAARVEALGAPSAAVHVIPSGVDTAWFTPTPLPEGPPVVGFVGRFVPKKGVDVLLAAWPAVRAAVPDARLALLGYGPEAASVDRRAGTDGVEVVRPDPARRAEQVRDLMRRSTVVVSPSRTALDGDAESLLLANLEAQASARAVVSTRHGGIPEFVADGDTGLLVAENDPDALAGAVVRVLTDRPLAERLGAAGPERVAALDARACSGRVDDLYDSLVAATVARR